ncbi:hypothetical protein ACFL0X_01925 [Nanoarchaeota archaeon]
MKLRTIITTAISSLFLATTLHAEPYQPRAGDFSYHLPEPEGDTTIEGGWYHPGYPDKKIPRVGPFDNENKPNLRS